MSFTITMSTAAPAPVPVPSVAPSAPIVAPVEPTSIDPDQRDEKGKRIPAFMLDRRKVRRPTSRKPLFSEIIESHIAKREIVRGQDNKDIKIARPRLALFLELIGDHPVDTYDGSDLQAYVMLMKHRPANNNSRDSDQSAFEILEANAGLTLKPLTRKTLKEGYGAVVRAAMRSGMTTYSYKDPFQGADIEYRDTAEEPVPAEPLSASKSSGVFRAGVDPASWTISCCRCWAT